MPGTTEELESLVAPAMEAAGLELIDIEIVPGALQVTIEGESGLNLDEVAAAAKIISALLDENEDVAPEGHYALEVSSPGLERRLRRRGHFDKAIGATISVRTVPGSGGQRRIEGVLSKVNEDSIVVTLEENETRNISFDEIERAHTVFDWKAALSQARRPEATNTSTSRRGAKRHHATQGAGDKTGEHTR